jgi:D-sedoheptulose 7-phosphate isomerase
MTGKELAQRYEMEVNGHMEVAARVLTDLPLWGAFWKLYLRCYNALHQGHKLVLFGNGGSAADAQHITAELVVKYAKQRRALPAIALTTDTSVLTAASNDFGFNEVFARQVHALCESGDVAIGLTTSGASYNVIRALSAARSRGAWTAVLTGRHCREDIADIVLHVPSDSTPRIQEMHGLLGHILCSALEEKLCPASTTR